MAAALKEPKESDEYKDKWKGTSVPRISKHDLERYSSRAGLEMYNKASLKYPSRRRGQEASLGFKRH